VAFVREEEAFGRGMGCAWVVGVTCRGCPAIEGADSIHSALNKTQWLTGGGRLAGITMAMFGQRVVASPTPARIVASSFPGNHSRPPKRPSDAAERRARPVL